MTPVPQKEYIITEEMVGCIEAWTARFPIVSKDIASVIRSRPYKSDAVLDDDKKPGCFGVYGLPSCNIPGCMWFARCKQSREDY